MSLHAMPFGAEIHADGTVRFRLWAPEHSQVRIELDYGPTLLAMQPLDGGWHELVTDRARCGTVYHFVLPDESRVPDPASRFQPGDVHGPSEVIDPTTYQWRQGNWRGRPWEETVLYELHVGAFTPAGTFTAIIEKLDHLVRLGVTAIELMPIADFPGTRNWGYDGVALYAPDATYGCPDSLRALVDAAHERGLMVLLDVVYNHFGPEGAYIHKIAPQAFTDRHKTPWGAAVNMDGAQAGPMREFIINNALYWLEEFHLDGLRLDAVHAILDDSEKHVLEELAERVRSTFPQRHVHLLLENEDNAVSLLKRDEDCRPALYSGQWNDDVHHVLHVAATNESRGYYQDYHHDGAQLGRALAEGFAFQGELMPYRGHPRGEPSGALPPTAFVAFIQNHDQIGNRAFGERLTVLTSPEALRALTSIYLLLPQIPMLFMGEEWAAKQPFLFFCDFEPELAEAVRKGRREEFTRFPEFQDPDLRERIPDPTAPATFAAVKLKWEELGQEPQREWLDWYTKLLATRRREIIPRMYTICRGGSFSVMGSGAVTVRWRSSDAADEELVLEANLSSGSVGGFATRARRVLWQVGEIGADGKLGPQAVRWSVGPPQGAQRGDATSSISALADTLGILDKFQDARGKLVETTQQTQLRLLAAMGWSIGDELQAAEALEDLAAQSWRESLPPVRVVTAGDEPMVVDIVVPAELRTVAWCLSLEDGTQRRSSVQADGLKLLDTRELAGRQFQRRRLVLDSDLPWGYHQLILESDGARMTLIVAPESCWLPPQMQSRERMWGLAAQLYLVRSSRNWGIGDFGDLRELVSVGASRGADVIGLNPLHAMFADAPEHASPYSPASRLLLNILYIDIDSLPELAGSAETRDWLDSPQTRERLAACRASHWVDYSAVTELKLAALEGLFRSCRAASDQTRWQAFQAFRRERGSALEQSCLFLALREHFARTDPNSADWHTWPAAYQDVGSTEVARFAEEHQQRVEFQTWLQWVADEQLAAAARTARERDMRIGLYRDLAVGVDRAGAEGWVSPATAVSGAQVGAPPDILNPAGQDWGLPPFNPHALRANAYRDFIQLIRANMRFAGALRIDHAMGLQQLYWVPKSATPKEGAYVRYPVDDLVGILALESHRQKCLIIGEDLGTVPQGFREKMSAAHILSYRVLFFEQDQEGRFARPRAYPYLSLAVAGNHDLPTLQAWWSAHDIELKERLGLYPDTAEAARQRDTRQRDKLTLLTALRREELLPAGGEPELRTLSDAIHAFLGRSASGLVMAQLDDISAEQDMVNVPASSTEYPNWRRRLSLTLEEISGSVQLDELAAVLVAERGRADP